MLQDDQKSFSFATTTTIITMLMLAGQFAVICLDMILGQGRNLSELGKTNIPRGAVV